jgi:hypothetical protein
LIYLKAAFPLTRGYVKEQESGKNCVRVGNEFGMAAISVPLDGGTQHTINLVAEASKSVAGH